MATVEHLTRAARRRRQFSPPLCRALRLNAGVTQEEIAIVVGVSRPAVSRWESGARHPRGEQLDRYLDALDALLTDTGAHYYLGHDEDPAAGPGPVTVPAGQGRHAGG